MYLQHKALEVVGGRRVNLLPTGLGEERLIAPLINGPERNR